jgi:butyrate kinase
MINKDILVIYPETKTTQVALYKGTSLLFLKNIKHDVEKLKSLKEEGMEARMKYRTEAVIKELTDNDADFEEIEIVVGRGGVLKPLNAGVYEVNEEMLHDLRTGSEAIHHTNLGGMIAYAVAKQINAKPILTDPVSVDEMDDIARVSGHPLFKRKSVFHALNQKYFARRFAKANHKKYNEINLIVATIGMGGISVAAHRKGRVVDVNNAFDGEGAFSIKRTGSLPMGDMVHLCFSGKYTEEEVIDMLTQKGGYVAYLGTANINEINAMIENGDEKAIFVSDACAYQVSKEIAAMSAVLEQNVDAIILTGNIFHSDRFLSNVQKRLGGIADFTLYPSINDVEALAANGFLVLKGELEVQEYI